MDGVDYEEVVAREIEEAVQQEDKLHRIYDLVLANILKLLTNPTASAGDIEVARKFLASANYQPPSIAGVQKSGALDTRGVPIGDAFGVDLTKIPVESLQPYQA